MWVDCSCWLKWVDALLLVKHVLPAHLVDESVPFFMPTFDWVNGMVMLADVFLVW